MGCEPCGSIFNAVAPSDLISWRDLLAEFTSAWVGMSNSTQSSSHLRECASLITSLPCVSVDHLGLSKAGLPILLDLAEHGVRVKATGFGRVDFDVPVALRDSTSANPESLMFGNDLPSNRAATHYQDTDFEMMAEATGWEQASRIYFGNAMNFHRLESREVELEPGE